MAAPRAQTKTAAHKEPPFGKFMSDELRGFLATANCAKARESGAEESERRGLGHSGGCRRTEKRAAGASAVKRVQIAAGVDAQRGINIGQYLKADIGVVEEI